MTIKKNKKEKNNDKKFHIAEILEVPRDVALGDSIITLIGKQEMLIENYKGVVEYDDKLLKVKTKNGLIELEGNHFLITYLTDEEIKITGQIKKIKY